MDKIGRECAQYYFEAYPGDCTKIPTEDSEPFQKLASAIVTTLPVVRQVWLRVTEDRDFLVGFCVEEPPPKSDKLFGLAYKFT